MDLLANAFEITLLTEKAKCKGFVFAQEAKQEMLSLYVRSTELAGLTAGEKDNPAGLFCVTFEHGKEC